MARRRNRKGRFAGFGRKHSRRGHRSYRGLGRRGRRSHRRGFRGLRGFGDFPSLDTLKSQVNGTDVLMGAGLGLLGVLALNYYINTHDHKAGLDPSKLFSARFTKSPMQGALMAAAAAAGAGILGYSFMHKDSGNKWTGMLVGAIGTGIAVAGSRLADAGYIPGPTRFPIYTKPGYVPPAGYSGYSMIQHDRTSRPMGALMPNKAPAAALARLSMALDDGDEIDKMLSGR
jgi:hypothetical protein